jgi:hypothetical protein
MLLLATGWLGWLVPAGIVGSLLAVTVVEGVRRRDVLKEVQRDWVPHGVRCLIVYSNSPKWQEHIENQWLPRLKHCARLLTLQDRGRRKGDLEARVFTYFCSGGYANPVVVVFRGLKEPLVFRFFGAFREARKGRPQYLRELESRLFAVLEVEGMAPHEGADDQASSGTELRS